MAETSTFDPFLLDLEQLGTLASEAILRRGILYAKENRVTDLYESERELTARVEGNREGDPYFVTIQCDEDNELLFQCDCPFEYEAVCKHMVAVLLFYGENKRLREETYQNAAEMAVADRRRRGVTEVVVQHLSGHPAFGVWRAQSLIQGVAQRSYEVHIRSQEEKQNYCECADHLTNLLGTCKHIEAVLHRLKSKTKKALNLQKPCFVYLAWDVPQAPQIRLAHGDVVSESTRKLLERFFNAEEVFRFDPHESYASFRALAASRDDLVLGLDVERYVRRLNDRHYMLERARQIQNELNASGGHVPGVHAQLYPYQREGVAFLAANGRGLLADDMGLGKTLQAISAAALLRQRGDIESCLVVCPASLKLQWAREIEKFTGLKSVIVQGTQKTRALAYRTQAPFHIVNYETVLRDFKIIDESLAPNLMILDEAQRIKNFRTKMADAIRRVQTPFVFVLTGTPLENRLVDLYSLVQLVDPHVLGPLWRFIPRYHLLNERGKIEGYRNLAELRRQMKPVLLRRDKSMIRGQLPEKIEMRLDVEMDGRQKGLHDSALSGAMKIAANLRYRKLTPSEERRFLSLLQQTRMACDAAGLVDGVTHGSPKLTELKRILEEVCEAPTQKVVIFSQWERMCAMAETVCRELQLGVVRLSGKVPTSKRGELVDAFWTHSDTRVFISTDAGGTGLNLQTASVLINLDMPWNPAVLNQRIARVHRLGQAEPTRVVLLLAADSYEQYVAELLNSKHELFTSLMDEESEVDALGIGRSMIKRMLDDLSIDNNGQVQLPGLQLPASESANEVSLPATESIIDPECDEEGASEQTQAQTAPDAESFAEPEVEIQIHEERQPPEQELRLRQLLSDIQERIGSRLERLVSTQGGLLALVQEVEPWMSEAVSSLSSEIKIGVISLKQFEILASMGLLGTVEEQKPAAKTQQEPQQINPQKRLAERKLKAAELLLSQEMASEALGPLSQAMLIALAARNQHTSPPAPGEAVAWIYGKAMPSGMLTAQEAATATQALALAQAQDAPGEMVHELLAEAHRWVAAL